VALEAGSPIPILGWHGRARCLDRIRGGPEVVGRYVCDGCGLARGVCRVARCAGEVAGGAVRMSCCRTSLSHGDLAARPGTGALDRPTWSLIRGPRGFEQVQDVLGTQSGPQGEKPMTRIGETSTLANRHEPTVADLREDHRQLASGGIGPTSITSTWRNA
jgi:hypothetical protein